MLSFALASLAPDPWYVAQLRHLRPDRTAPGFNGWQRPVDAPDVGRAGRCRPAPPAPGERSYPDRAERARGTATDGRDQHSRPGVAAADPGSGRGAARTPAQA